MVGLVERYVSEVVRRLPEDEREDVRSELTCNIYDMLPDEPSDDQIASILSDLGSPALLANQYRHEQRYLISPALYTNYIRVLKWIIPLAGSVLMIFGLILGLPKTLDSTASDLGGFALSIITMGLIPGVVGALNALILTTAGFAIAERITSRSNGKEKLKWTVDQLPPAIDEEKAKIPLSKGTKELVATAITWSLTILILLGTFLLSYISEFEDYNTLSMVAESFVLTAIPIYSIICLCGIVVSVLKIVKQRWTPLVCAGVVVMDVVGVGLFIFLAMQPQVFSPHFVDISRSEGWWDIAEFSLGNVDFALTTGDLMIGFTLLVISIGALVEIILAIIRTVKAQRYINT